MRTRWPRPEHFPWVTFWEENRARRDAPWRSEVQARGLDVRVERDEIVLMHGTKQVRVVAQGAAAFLGDLEKNKKAGTA